MKPWLTYSEAALVLQRSKRTIRLWVHDGRRSDANPMLRIQVELEGRITLLRTEDLSRVAAFKDRYRDAPTFGRTRRNG